MSESLFWLLMLSMWYQYRPHESGEKGNCTIDEIVAITGIVGSLIMYLVSLF